ncbi:MAG: hypothetical protein ABFS12_06900 [Bacteroidota bacterium]
MLQQFLIIFGFFILAIGLMLLSLHLSKYKKRPEGSCSGGHCAAHNFKDENHSCSSHHHKTEAHIETDELEM